MLAVLLAAAAGFVLAGRAEASRRRLSNVCDAVVDGSRSAALQSRLGVVVTSVVAALALAAFVGGGRLLIGCLAGLVTASMVRRVLRLRRQRELRLVRQRAVLRLCDRLAAEMRAGLPAVTALERSCADEVELAPVVHAARLGVDIGASLHRCAEVSGSETLRAVAAAWGVAGTSGAALATVLDRIAAALRFEEEARAEVTAALGPPRATAKMLAVLPVFGIALGSSIGARPLAFLTGTPAGLGCLACGGALALLGVFWVERLAAAAEL